MKLKIERPDWKSVALRGDAVITPSVCDVFNNWFDTHVEPINKLLAEGVEVYTGASGIWPTHHENAGLTHRALLIKIEPIRKETAEEVLRDLVALLEKYNSVFVTNEEYKRAKRVLGNHDKR